MSAPSLQTRDAPATRQRLVSAAVALIRSHGFSTTTVDKICAEAGVTKGAFFHHFPSKDAIGEAAIEAWCQSRVELYLNDLGDPQHDPLSRLNRWLDGLIESVRNPGEPLVCLLGMMSQELAGTHDRMRGICQHKLEGWTSLAATLLRAAKQAHPPKVDFDPEQVAWMLNSLWQGSLLVAKTKQDPELIASNLEIFRDYLAGLFATHSTSQIQSCHQGVIPCQSPRHPPILS